ncbi:FeoA family protein [Blastochloris sulfoviridis]|nr:ferrous iron transport protein A [Blastochloris sulfoviridis]
MTDMILSETALETASIAGGRGAWQDDETPARRLDHLRPGESCRVVALLGVGAVRRRLLDMGIVPSVCVEVIRNAPLRDPIEIRVHNTFMTLRRVEANRIEVTAVGES